VKIEADRFRVRPRTRVRLTKIDSGATRPFESKDQTLPILEAQVQRLSELQSLLYADRRYALLLILQGMDASGKDGIVSHVMRGLNPQGTSVVPFKTPSDEEVAHDFLWRVVRHLPAKGDIAVFNRSHYEEVLVVRVHPEFLERQHLPDDDTGSLWQRRFEDIRQFEQHLIRSGTVIRKFFLHVSREEQRQRLLARLLDPTKNWKFSAADLAERRCWPRYVEAYEDMLSATSTRHAPWYIVPSDHKWFARCLVAQVIIEALEALGLRYPRLAPAQVAHLERAVTQLKRKRG